MKNLTENQAYLFLIYCLCGIIIGIFFDIFRILRKSFKTNDFVTYIEDIFLLRYIIWNRNRNIFNNNFIYI